MTADRRQHCNAHEEFLVAVTKLASEVQSIRSIFKWTITTMVTLSMFMAGAAGTFVYNVGDVKAQVMVNTAKIAHIEKEKE